MDFIFSNSFSNLEENELFTVNAGDSTDWLGIIVTLLGICIGGIGFLFTIPFSGTIATIVTLVGLFISWV